MRLAVVQMLPVGESEADATRLTALIAQAREMGADVLVLPALPSIVGAGIESLLAAEDDRVSILPPPTDDEPAPPWLRQTPLGGVVDLVGDQAIDPELHVMLQEAAPNALVLRPEAESPLQAEAILELAIGYSRAIAGIVLIPATAETDPLSDDTFGGSAIVQHGEILAEAVDADEVLVADVDPSVRLQEPPAPLPEPQLILRQRLAHHRGGKAPVEWLADLD